MEDVEALTMVEEDLTMVEEDLTVLQEDLTVPLMTLEVKVIAEGEEDSGGVGVEEGSGHIRLSHAVEI